jgi:hypothetical protein
MDETSQSWRIEMICGRSAMLTLIACMVVGAPSRGSQITAFQADRLDSLIAGHFVPVIGWPDSSRLLRGATLSQFTPWKTRIKSVLEETKQRFTEECDLGPAMLSGRFFKSASFRLPSCPVAISPPLRC